MGFITVTNTFVGGSAAVATQVNQNFTDIINGSSDGTKDFTIANAVCTSLTASGIALFSGGTSSAPSIAFSLETTLGIYRSGTGGISLVGSNNGTLTFSISNQHATGGSALQITTQSGSTNDNYIFLFKGGSSSTAWCLGRDDSDSGAFCISQSATAVGTSNFLKVTVLGSVVLNNAALATAATDGFLYLASCAGAPTGVPTSNTGRTPLVYDSTNNKLYAYVAGWKSVTLS